MPSYGQCKLTGHTGKYVKAHIIPEALSKPSTPGESFIQAGKGDRPVRRWTSWYDPDLVTSEGEQILAKYDNWGIGELRRLKLVWSSGEGIEISDFSDWNATGNDGHGVRIIEYSDGEKMRLFLLSILWRAAASRLPELKHIHIPQHRLNRLGKMLVTGDPNPNFLFAACLIQLTGYGPRHNLTPLTGRKRIGPKKRDQIRIFRFYLDGISIHFHRDPIVSDWLRMGNLCIQAGDKIGVITVPFLISHQSEVLEKEARDAELQWPQIIAKLSR